MNGIYTKDEPPPTSSQCPPSSSAEIISEAAKDGVDAKGRSTPLWDGGRRLMGTSRPLPLLARLQRVRSLC